MLRDEVAYLPRKVRLACAEPPEASYELQELLPLLESALNGGVTLEGRMGRRLQSTMKWSLRKSFRLSLPPCLMMSHLTYLQTEKPVLSMAQMRFVFLLLFPHSGLGRR